MKLQAHNRLITTIFKNPNHWNFKTTIAPTQVAIQQGKDYCLFCAPLPGRTWQGTSDKYRYGMNTQEKDDEIFVGAMSAEYWEYDSRIGRRWNIDPIVDESISPYATFADSPILMSDPDGLSPKTPKGKNRSNLTKRRYMPHKYREHKHKPTEPKGKKGDGVSKHRHPSIGEIFMKVVGALRLGSHYHLALIPQGRYVSGHIDVSGTVAPGGEDVVNFRQNLPGGYMAKVTGITGEIYNADAGVDIVDGWHDEGPIEGFASVDGITAGRGWHGIHLNTGLRGWMPSLLSPKQFGGILVGSEMIPGGNLFDDIFGGLIPQIRAFEFINKSVLNPMYKYTAALKVKNASFTKHKIGYDLTIRYRQWGAVNNWNGTQRSGLWRKLHNVAK